MAWTRVWVWAGILPRAGKDAAKFEFGEGVTYGYNLIFSPVRGDDRAHKSPIWVDLDRKESLPNGFYHL